MTQTLPASAQLSPRRQGQKLGYVVLNLDRSTFAPFTRRGVIESGNGCFAVRGGVTAPDAGGYVVWRLADGEAIAESTVAPVPPLLLSLDALHTDMQAALSGLPDRLAAAVPTPAAPIVEMAPFVSRVAELSDALQSGQSQGEARWREVAEALRAVCETAGDIGELHANMDRVVGLAGIRHRIDGVLGERIPGVIAESSAAPVTAAIEGLRAEMGQFVEAASADRAASDKLGRAVAALDRFLGQTGGGS